MKNKTLIFFIDAVRKDYISEKYTPFLYEYIKKNTYLDAVSQLGYSSGIHPSIWKGKHQENHGNFLVYYFVNGNGPFKWIKYFGVIPNKIRQFLLGVIKAPFYMLKLKNYFPKWYKKFILPIPASINPKAAPYFNNKSSIYDADFFKILEKNNITYSSQPDHDNKMYGKGVTIKGWSLTENDVDFYFSYEIDPIGHYSGPNSKEIKEKMSEIDSQIEKLIKKAENENENVDVFMFSDHGMVEITENIDIKTTLDKSDLKLVDDYLVFFDSTMVRFWIKNEKAKEKIIMLLKDTKNITYLDEKLKEKYKINFKDNRWGDLIFLVEPGFRVFPDYFAPVKFNTRGMHGYWPEHQDGKGIFITNSFKTNKKEIHVTEFMPTMLKAMGFESLIPDDIDGKSII